MRLSISFCLRITKRLDCGDSMRIRVRFGLPHRVPCAYPWATRRGTRAPAPSTGFGLFRWGGGETRTRPDECGPRRPRNRTFPAVELTVRQAPGQRIVKQRISDSGFLRVTFLTGSAAMCRQEQRGATLVEMLFMVGALCIGLLGARVGGARHGWSGHLVGFAAGVAVVLGAGFLYALLVDVLWSGLPPHPRVCRHGKCSFAGWRIRRIANGGMAWVCSCGDCYQKRGRLGGTPAGWFSGYVIWRACRGWRPDGPPP